jgi:hypothetical protein
VVVMARSDMEVYSGGHSRDGSQTAGLVRHGYDIDAMSRTTISNGRVSESAGSHDIVCPAD